MDENEENEDQQQGGNDGAQEQPKFVTSDDLKAFEDRILAALKPAPQQSQAKPDERQPDLPGSYDADAIKSYARNLLDREAQALAAQIEPIRKAIQRTGMEAAISAGVTEDQRQAILDKAELLLTKGVAEDHESAVRDAMAILGIKKEHRKGIQSGGAPSPSKTGTKSAADLEDEILAKHGI